MKALLGTVAGLIILVLAIIGVQNPTLITVRFLGWQTGFVPLWVVMVAALVSGMLLVSLIAVPGRIHRYRTTRQLKHQLASADASIVALEQPAQSSRRVVNMPMEHGSPSMPTTHNEGTL